MTKKPRINTLPTTQNSEPVKPPKKYNRDPRNKRFHNLRHRYGVTAEKYDSLLKDQGGRCAVCQWLPIPGKHLAVDHNHDTGQVRGLLCHYCNTMVGMAKDDWVILLRGAEYIVQHD